MHQNGARQGAAQCRGGNNGPACRCEMAGGKQERHEKFIVFALQHSEIVSKLILERDFSRRRKDESNFGSFIRFSIDLSHSNEQLHDALLRAMQRIRFAGVTCVEHYGYR